MSSHEPPRSTTPLGYAALIAGFGLDPVVDRPLRCASTGDIWKRSETTDPVSGRKWVVHRPIQAPKPGAFRSSPEDPAFFAWHLDFALRNEGVNLAILADLFHSPGSAEIARAHVADWVRAEPTGRHARRAWFLTEWLTGDHLDLPDTSIEGFYVQAVDPGMQVAPVLGARSRRHHVVDNMPGTREWCPMVWATDELKRYSGMDLSGRARQLVSETDQETARRAAGWLFAKETRDSFAIEHEKPSPEKTKRFIQMLTRASSLEGRRGSGLSEQAILDIVGEVLDGSGKNPGYRSSANYVFRKSGGGNRGVVDYISPDAADVPAMMRGLVAQSNRLSSAGIDPVIVSAMAKFGLVYIHPFVDGNGRTSRFLIHSTLAGAGYTPAGSILPVSAAIARDIAGYDQALEGFSRPLMERLTWSLGDDGDLAVRGGDRSRHYRYMDLTRQAEFLYRCVEQTVEHDLPQEIAFIEGFDEALAGATKATGMAEDNANLLVKLIHENGGTLSRKKRRSLFADLADDQVTAAETAVNTAMRAHGFLPTSSSNTVPANSRPTRPGGDPSP